MKRCNECEMLSINGIPSHELGCVNENGIKCSDCGEFTRSTYYANDWDGIKLCRDCADRQAAYEAEIEDL